MEHKITSWKFQFLVGETQPWKGHLGLYCNLAHFVQLSNIEIIYFGLPGEIPQELQEDKFWDRRICNLNGIFWVPVYLWCSFILDFLNLVTKSHRKFRLLENHHSGQESLSLLASNCWEIRQNSASKQAESEEPTTSSNSDFLCKHSSWTCSSQWCK